MKKNRLFLLAILLLGIGFAAVSTTLLVTGNVKIATNNADFDVRFTKAEIYGSDVSNSISPDGKTIEYETGYLLQVNDISKFDFEITNYSTMYDADVSVELTIDETNSEYYEITKEVPASIEAQRTEKGKIEVKLKKASTEDIKGTFRITLKATAKERTLKAPLAPATYAFGNPTTASTTDYTTLGKNVFVKLENEQKSVCIVRNNKLECFKNNNWDVEKDHVQQVFASCDIPDQPVGIVCSDSDFGCNVDSDGDVVCTYMYTNSICDLYSDGFANCHDY